MSKILALSLFLFCLATSSLAQNCTAGSFLNQTSCTLCPVGQYRAADMPVSQCQKCEEKSYAPRAGSSSCMYCEDGLAADNSCQWGISTMLQGIVILSSVAGFVILVRLVIWVRVKCCGQNDELVTKVVEAEVEVSNPIPTYSSEPSKNRDRVSQNVPFTYDADEELEDLEFSSVPIDGDAVQMSQKKKVVATSEVSTSGVKVVIRPDGYMSPRDNGSTLPGTAVSQAKDKGDRSSDSTLGASKLGSTYRNLD